MFRFKNKIKNIGKEHEKKNYDLTYDNVASPEVHKTSSTPNTAENTTAAFPSESSDEQTSSVSFDNVAIPEIHIRKKN